MLKAFVMALCAHTFLTLLFPTPATAAAEQTLDSDYPYPPGLGASQPDTSVPHDKRSAVNG